MYYSRYYYLLHFYDFYTHIPNTAVIRSLGHRITIIHYYIIPVFYNDIQQKTKLRYNFELFLSITSAAIDYKKKVLTYSTMILHTYEL